MKNIIQKYDDFREILLSMSKTKNRYEVRLNKTKHKTKKHNPSINLRCKKLERLIIATTKQRQKKDAKEKT